MIARLLLVATATLALVAPAAAQDFAITNATVATGDGSAPVENATVVVQNGRVVAAGFYGAVLSRDGGQAVVSFATPGTLQHLCE